MSQNEEASFLWNVEFSEKQSETPLNFWALFKGQRTTHERVVLQIMEVGSSIIQSKQFIPFTASCLIEPWLWEHSFTTNITTVLHFFITELFTNLDFKAWRCSKKKCLLGDIIWRNVATATTWLLGFWLKDLPKKKRCVSWVKLSSFGYRHLSNWQNLWVFKWIPSLKLT